MDISLQLYSLRTEASGGLGHLLELTEKAGYQGVEFAGYFDLPAAQVKELLAKYHLKAVSAHAAVTRLREGFETELDYAKQLGFKLLVCAFSACKTKEEVLEDAKFLESCAKTAAKEGIAIGYHNHSHEFTNQFDGKRAMDILLDSAPSVKFQPDVFWIARGGVDPVTYITPWAKAGRICAVHAKELGKDGTSNVYVGQGVIDFKAIKAICPPDLYPYIVEQEELSGEALDGIAQSYRGLKAYLS